MKYLNYILEKSDIINEIETNENKVYNEFVSSFSINNMKKLVIENLDKIIVKNNLKLTRKNIKEYVKNKTLEYLINKSMELQ